jgi:hypothetical protein
LFIVFNTHLVTKYINRVVLQPAKEASCKQSTLFSNFAIKNVVLYNSLFTVAWRSHISMWCANYEKNRINYVRDFWPIVKRNKESHTCTCNCSKISYDIYIY